MKIKKNASASTSDFWYDLNNGYIQPDELCVNKKDAQKIIEAIATINEFENACAEQIGGFYR
jgi:hypothetical protein